MTVKTTMTLAEQARANRAKALAESNGSLFAELTEVIEDISKRGANGLSLFWYDDPDSPQVEVDRPEYYIGVVVRVNINTAPSLNNEDLIERFKTEGFAVTTFNSNEYGECIDTIKWC